MEQNLTLEKAISIEGTLLMLDDITPHVAVPVQAIRDGEVMATTLSSERGGYLFINLKPGRYQVRSHVLGGFVYYGEGGSTVADESRAVFLRVKHGATRGSIDLRLAPGCGAETPEASSQEARTETWSSWQPSPRTRGPMSHPGR